MENFSTSLLNRIIVLENASDIVRFSFIVQKSISYLDLKLCDKLMVFNCLNKTCGCCALKFSSYFINTEEKCRKYFTSRRNLLYTLHLDLPKKREYSLKKVPKTYNYEMCEDIPHLAKIIAICGFSDKLLSNFIQDFIRVNNQKLRILKWILKMDFFDRSMLYYLEIETVNEFIHCFHPTITDPALFKNFIMQVDIVEWIITYEDQEIVEFLLSHARHFGREDLRKDAMTFDATVDHCLINRFLKNIGPVLKYIDAPTFPKEDYWLYPNEILSMRSDLNVKEFRKAEKQTGLRRMHKLMQLIWMYVYCDVDFDTETALETLRLIWSSIPDPYISFEEFGGIFWKVFSAEELERIYDFYGRAVGEFCEKCEPRSLQHLCRTVIRKTLRKNQYWIPEGIRQMGLSKPIQSFLNIEKTFCISNEFGL
ncbi:uncharacterized protein LOC129988785 [Argiope bruennichi]|uniref:uncharacterized protein LOC129988785 n=1 Tax=Argiope bruennichi TaxID=94029 RepID=UPI00249532DE|nr:uncharacterized protein LOC129988785 [Argiope bruennichi]